MDRKKAKSNIPQRLMLVSYAKKKTAELVEAQSHDWWREKTVLKKKTLPSSNLTLCEVEASSSIYLLKLVIVHSLVY
jgi:hypothetical protein